MKNKQEQQFKEHQKLLDLENKKSEVFDKLVKFRKIQGGYLSDKKNYTDPKYCKLHKEFMTSFKVWEKFRENLEFKYKFTFPVSCKASRSGHPLFSEYFKTEFNLVGGASL
jgi:hypothetical protein